MQLDELLAFALKNRAAPTSAERMRGPFGGKR